MILSQRIIIASILEGLCLLSSWGQGGSVPLIILDGGVACDWSKDQITRLIDSKPTSCSLLGQIEARGSHAWAGGSNGHGLG